MPFAWTERVRHTLALRLALWYTTLFAASVVLLFGLTYALLSASLRRRDREAVRSTLADYVSAYQEGGLNGLRRALSTADQLGSHADLVVRVAARGDEVLFLSPARRFGDFELQQLPRPPSESGETWTRLPARQGDAVLEVASAFLPDGTLVQVGRSTAEREELLRRFRSIMLAVLAMTLAVGVAGGVFLTHWSLRPLRDLAETVRQIVDTGRLTSRVPVRETGDPLDELAALLNRMLDRIESLVGAMGESLDSVAHDLRTPLTRLRASAERALAAPKDADLGREALSDCLEESDRVLALLETLMDVAEAETGSMRLHSEAIDLGSLLGRMADLYADAAEDKGVALSWAAPEGLRVMGDTHRLSQALANLVDNAIKYTPSGGHVELSAAEQGVEVVLTVSDSGVGIAADDLPRVFERLFRGDRSRTERGLGLGLSLAQAIVLAHKGRIDVESEPGGGSRFAIHLPGAAAGTNLTPV